MAKTETKVIEIRIDLLKGLTDIAELQKRIDSLTASNKANDKSTADLKNQYAANSVALKDYRMQVNSLIKESANEIRTIVEKTGHIEKLKAQVSNLTLQYERLTKAELESSKGTQVLTDLKGKREELAKLSAAYGNHQLNVGNYSSATKMLGINLGQVMKELPNFAISARIGIMSLTNNLPILGETIKALRVEQIAAKKAQEQLTAAQLAALPNGGKLPSMFSLITKSVFGLTGVMSLLMVAFQLWGNDLVQWIGGLFKAGKALDETRLKQEALNDIIKNGSNEIQNAYKNTRDVSIAFSEYKSGILTSTEALKIYNDKLGDQLGKQTDINFAIDKFNQLGPKYLELQWKMGLVAEYGKKAAEAYIAENAAKEKSDKEYSNWFTEFVFKVGNLTGKSYNTTTQINDQIEEDRVTRKDKAIKTESDKNKKFADLQQKAMDDAILFSKQWNLQILNLTEENSERYRKAIIKDFDFEKLMNEATAKMLQEGVEKDIQELDNQLAERKKKIEDYIDELKQKKTSLEEQLAQTKDPKKQKLIREDITRYSTEITETQTGQKDFEVKQAEQRESMIQDIKNKWHAKNLQSLATEKANEYQLLIDSHNETIEEETRYQVELAKIKTDKAVEAKNAEIDVLKKRLLDIKDINSTEYKDVQNLISQHEATKIQIIKSGKEQEVNITQSGYEKQLQYIQQFQATEFERIVTTQREKLEFELKQKEERLAALKNETEEEKLIYAKLETDIALTQSAIAKLKLDNIKGYTNQFLSGISDIVSSINSMQTSNLENEKNKELAIAGDNAKAREEIEKDYAQKELDLKKKQANAAMGIAIAQAVATGALGIAEIWSRHAGIPFVGVPMATALTALLGGIMLAQIGAAVAQRNAIMSQTLDTSSSGSSSKVSKTTVTEKFHTGGTNTAQTGVETPATLLGGESVNTIATTQMFSPLLSALNQLGGGKAITSGVANTGMGTDMLASAFSKALRNMPAPTLIYEEFEKASDKYNKIQNNRIIK